jgi:putative nucleotidyltransferase with HDIG domain
MKRGHLLHFRRWFRDYVRHYYSDDPDYQAMVVLKEEHTVRVCREVLDIARSLDLAGEELYLAETMALFHDIGRFEQLARYGTFADFKSENHALLGVRILREEGILDILPDVDRRLILAAVFWHNRAAPPPEGGRGRLPFFARLLRDGDKLDIWRVVTFDYKRAGGPRNTILGLGLPDDPRISSKVMEEILAGEQVSSHNLRTRNDFKLMQLSWIYDINFFYTFRQVLEREYLEIIRDSLPPSEEVERAYGQARRYAEDKARVDLQLGRG